MRYIIALLLVQAVSSYGQFTVDDKILRAAVLRQEKIDQLQKRIDQAISGDGHWLGASNPIKFKGPTGDKGPQGDKGPIGDSGNRGDRGPTGNKGVSGNHSSWKGPQGDRGHKGYTGDRGPQGPSGIAVPMCVGRTCW